MANFHTGNVQPSIDLEEHVSKGQVNAKRVVVYQYDAGTDTLSPLGTAAALDERLDDYTTANVTYVGKAAIGSSTASAVWQIQKIDETTGMVISWGGTGIADQIWDNRATTVVYS